MGTAPGHSPHLRALRGDAAGWSAGATRRNLAFLRSVEPDSLAFTSQGQRLLGLALTLTLLECPPTPEDWHKLRRAMMMRLSRMGLYRGHWVVEWQRRGVPHLHGAFYFPEPASPTQAMMLCRDIKRHWMEVVRAYGASVLAQHAKPITDSIGWFKYTAKHAARGVHHYQRSSQNVPPHWQQRTGRVWGKVGHWVTRDPMEFEMSDRTFYRFRRLCRSWRIADARRSREKNRLSRISSARRCLTCSDRVLSDVRGVSEWIPLEVSLVMLDLARGDDQVEQIG